MKIKKADIPALTENLQAYFRSGRVPVGISWAADAEGAQLSPYCQLLKDLMEDLGSRGFRKKPNEIKAELERLAGQTNANPDRP